MQFSDDRFGEDDRYRMQLERAQAELGRSVDQANRQVAELIQMDQRVCCLGSSILEDAS